MIVIVHNRIHVVEVYNTETNSKVNFQSNESLIDSLLSISKENSKELLVWVFQPLKVAINFKEIAKTFHHKLVLASFTNAHNYGISNKIGYVENTPFTNINKKVNFPTWLMSSDIGGIYAEILNEISITVPKNSNLDYYLTSLAKHNMPLGLFCYSSPNLLKQSIDLKQSSKISSSNSILFKFVKQHYKWLWCYNLLICFIVFERRLPVIAFFKSLFRTKIKKSKYLNPNQFSSNKHSDFRESIDVVIPTLGRKKYLLDVLRDLSNQTFLPNNVIIIEQTPNVLESELDYINNQSWPFNIKQRTITKTGACNARNLAFKMIESNWCFLADDDIRFNNNLIKEALSTIKNLGANAINISCLLKGQKQTYKYIHQTDIFASGASIVKTEYLKKIQFDITFEHGFGEDADFGMQLRNLGADVIYTPNIKLTHLKAPIGGFRATHKFPWKGNEVQPKPSPTIMLYLKKHMNDFQLKGYKLVLFLKFFRKQKVKNPFKYLKLMNKQWKSSVYWSEQLLKKGNA